MAKRSPTSPCSCTAATATPKYGIERLHRDAHGPSPAARRLCGASASCPSCSAAPSTSAVDGQALTMAGSVDLEDLRTHARRRESRRAAVRADRMHSSSPTRGLARWRCHELPVRRQRCRCCVLADGDAYPRAARAIVDNPRVTIVVSSAGTSLPGRRMLAIRGVAEVHDDRDEGLVPAALCRQARRPSRTEFMQLLDSDNASSSRFVPWGSPRATTPARCPATGEEAPVANHLMVVLSNAKPGQEDEFNPLVLAGARPGHHQQARWLPVRATVRAGIAAGAPPCRTATSRSTRSRRTSSVPRTPSSAGSARARRGVGRGPRPGGPRLGHPRPLRLHRGLLLPHRAHSVGTC